MVIMKDNVAFMLACVEEDDSSDFDAKFLSNDIFEDPPVHLERLGIVNSLVFERFETAILVLNVPVPYEWWISSRCRFDTHENARSMVCQ